MSASEINTEFQIHHASLQLALNGIPYSSVEVEDVDVGSSALFEGVFLQAFTSFERSLEALFLHYAVGGASVGGYFARSRLSNCSESQARTIIKADQRYVDWSSPSVVRERANRFFVSGEPFMLVLGPRSDILAEAEKIRNRIAHDSPEALHSMKEVERARFLTERTFSMRAGQMLRARRRKKPFMSIAAEHLGNMAEIIENISKAST